MSASARRMIAVVVLAVPLLACFEIDGVSGPTEVELGEISPPWGPYAPPAEAGGETPKGFYHWQLSLGPGEAEQLRAAYRIRISSKHELVGGNRRET